MKIPGIKTSIRARMIILIILPVIFIYNLVSLDSLIHLRQTTIKYTQSTDPIPRSHLQIIQVLRVSQYDGIQLAHF